MSSFDVNKYRADFPILSQKIHGKPLVYMDNAATTQKPIQVIDSLSNYYREFNSNVHRGVHFLSQKATDMYESSRKVVQEFLNAPSEKEIIFTRGTTEAINLIASTYGRANLKQGDEIIVSEMEHHSNIVPWQIVAQEMGAKIKVIPINDAGEIIFEEYEKLLSDRTKIVSIVHVSNSLGTINPVKQIIEKAHQRSIPVVVDGAQSVQHIEVDVQELDCDFYAISGHKLYGPTGIGALYGKKEILENLPPYHGGGDMILTCSFEKTVYTDLPHRFEAGTPNIADAIAMAEALKYLKAIGISKIADYETELLEYGTEKLSSIKELKLIGTSTKKSSILSFVLDNIHPHDIGTFIDMEGIAIRTGHHCTEPVMHRFKVPATSRASLAFYNTKEEIDSLAEAIKNVIKMFS